MGIFSRFENKAEDVIEGSGSRTRGGIEPVRLAKRASKEMEREKMVGVGHEYAPTLYNILVSPEDDAAMSGYYPSLSGEIETYLTGQGAQSGLVFDCPPLVRFIVDEGLKRGKFDIIAESVSPAIIAELRHEEMVRYGIERDYDTGRGYDDGLDYAPEEDRAFEEPARPIVDEMPASNDYMPERFAAEERAGAFADDPVDDFAFEEIENLAAEGAPVPDAGVAVAAAAAADALAPTSAEETVMLAETQPETPTAFLYNIKRRIRYRLRDDRTIIGREVSCDVVIPDPSVSRRHAEILHSEKGWLIRDTGSTNGIAVNGTVTTQSRIYDGDLIDLGTTKLEFQEG